MREELVTTIIQVVVPVIAAAIGIILTALANNASDYLKQKANSTLLNRYIDLLTETVMDVVQSLNQTTVEQLKQAAMDGKLTQEEIDSISAQALTSVKAILGEKGMEILSIAFEDVDALITSKIERAVREVKPPLCTTRAVTS